MKDKVTWFLFGLLASAAVVAYARGATTMQSPEVNGRFQMYALVNQFDKNGMPETANVFLVDSHTGDVWQWKDRGESSVKDTPMAKSIPQEGYLPSKLFVKTWVAK